MPVYDYNSNTKTLTEVGIAEKGDVDMTIKSVTYTGTGAVTNSVTFPEKPFMVIGFTQDPIEDKYTRGMLPFIFERSSSQLCLNWTEVGRTGNTYMEYSNLRVEIDGNTMSWTGPDASQALNMENVRYTIYYI